MQFSYLQWIPSIQMHFLSVLSEDESHFASTLWCHWWSKNIEKIPISTLARSYKAPRNLNLSYLLKWSGYGNEWTDDKTKIVRNTFELSLELNGKYFVCYLIKTKCKQIRCSIHSFYPRCSGIRGKSDFCSASLLEQWRNGNNNNTNKTRRTTWSMGLLLECKHIRIIHSLYQTSIRLTHPRKRKSEKKTIW